MTEDELKRIANCVRQRRHLSWETIEHLLAEAWKQQQPLMVVKCDGITWQGSEPGAIQWFNFSEE